MKPLPSRFIGIANELPGAVAEQIQIPYGFFPHDQGLQKFDLAAARDLVANFISGRSRDGDRFSGAPIYVGHPDVPSWAKAQPAGVVDKKAYGWIMNMEAREDGLYLLPTWNEPGKQLVEQKQYKFYSPVWNAQDGGKRNGQNILIPTRFVSLGLTNEPNIPVLPLANEGGNGELAARATALRKFRAERRDISHFYGL